MTLVVPPLSAFGDVEQENARRRHPTWRNYHWVPSRPRPDRQWEDRVGAGAAGPTRPASLERRLGQRAGATAAMQRRPLPVQPIKLAGLRAVRLKRPQLGHAGACNL